MISSSGLYINTCKWDLVKTAFLKKGRNIANRWLVNQGHESVKGCMFFSLSDDYKYKSFCRK